jgi:hypothetical protein
VGEGICGAGSHIPASGIGGGGASVPASGVTDPSHAVRRSKAIDQRIVNTIADECTLGLRRDGMKGIFCLFSLALLAACDGGGPMATPDAGTTEMPPPCDYPEASGMLRVGETMPALAWRDGRALDGSALDFAMRDFYCSDEYDRYTSMIVLVSAGWCSACPAYIDMLNGMSEDLEAAGVLLVYVEVETLDFMPATSEDAVEFIDSCVAPDEFFAGLRIGDAGSTSETSVRTMVSQFPSAYFVRRRDMHIVADQSASIYVIDFPALAADPEQTWTPQLPPFEPHCDPLTEEESVEPNDSFEQASELAPETEVMGGVCAPAPDFYHVTIEGPWRFDLYQSLFTTKDPDTHDLNLRLWSESMERIGGSNQRANHDWVDYQGPAYVEVYGESNASGLYRVSVSPR